MQVPNEQPCTGKGENAFHKDLAKMFGHAGLEQSASSGHRQLNCPPKYCIGMEAVVLVELIAK